MRRWDDDAARVIEQSTRRAVLVGGAAMSASALIAGFSGPALAKQAPILRFTGPIPITAKSKPWGSAMDGGPREALVKRYGYVEKEYFLSGTANVYGPGVAEAIPQGLAAMEYSLRLRPLEKLARPDVPFTTRVVVLMPADMSKFSGIVHMIPFHNVDGTTYTEKNLMRNGDVWMGLEVNSGTRFGVEERPSGGVTHLRNFNPARYGRMSIPAGLTTDWPDLQPGRLGEAFKTINFGKDSGAHYFFLQEISRSYAQAPDIMTKLAEALRNNVPGNPLFGHKVRRVYTNGRSGQSTILKPYVSYHHEAARAQLGHVPFDGYMIRVGSMPMHRPSGSVLVIIQSEAEAPNATPYLGRLGDSDDPMFRYYEIPGVGHGLTSRPNVSHRMVGVIPDGVQGLSDIEGHSEYQPLDKVGLPLQWAMWHNIYNWVENGIPMPRAPRIDREPSMPGGLARDRFGNVTGGIRFPWMDDPDASYIGVIHEKNPLEGGMMPFSEVKMKELYGSKEAYLKKLDVRLERLVKDGWLLAEDLPLMRARGVSPALAIGFEDYDGDNSVGLSPSL